MFNILNLINSLLSLSLIVFLVLPIALLIAYICSSLLSSLIGGPTWVWFIIMFILALPATKGGIEKSKQKLQQEREV